MPAMFDRELRRLLRRAGCIFVRAGKGSHNSWYSPIIDRRFVSRHTANGILSQTCLPKSFLRA
jgi:hypothetical protein